MNVLKRLGDVTVFVFRLRSWARRAVSRRRRAWWSWWSSWRKSGSSSVPLLQWVTAFSLCLIVEHTLISWAFTQACFLCQTIESFAAQEKQMEVCEVCGAFLIVGDAQSRVDDHLMGKQHMGYAKIKSTVEELKVSWWSNLWFRVWYEYFGQSCTSQCSAEQENIS